MTVKREIGKSRGKRQEGVATRILARGYKETVPTLEEETKEGETKQEDKKKTDK
jgi:hypothetical protein